MRRGRQTKAVVTDSLEELVKHQPEGKSLLPWVADFNGKTFFTWASGYTNAVRQIAVYINIKPRIIGYNELIPLIKEKQ